MQFECICRDGWNVLPLLELSWGEAERIAIEFVGLVVLILPGEEAEGESFEMVAGVGLVLDGTQQLACELVAGRRGWGGAAGHGYKWLIEGAGGCVLQQMIDDSKRQSRADCEAG